jgi:hypothetical protein
MNNTENTTQACLHCHGNGELVYDSTVSDTICQLCGKWQESTPLNNFADEAYTLLSKLDALVNKTIKKKGDTSQDCQLTHLINLIQKVEHAVNGTEESDLMSDSEIREYFSHINK